MTVFNRIWAALGRVADAANSVADSLGALSASFREANSHVRQHLSLDAQAPLEAAPPALPPPEEATKKNGRAKVSA